MENSAVAPLARNFANRKKVLIAGNIVMWVLQGLYTVSPIDLIPDILPLLGWVDDLFGLMVTVAFTVYTVSILYKHGAKALLPNRSKENTADKTIDMAPTETESGEITGYEPLSIEEIRAL
jgi:uncharacterized membrane protein YkvA (DUF1232 family)